MIEFGKIEIDIVEYSNISDFAVYKGPFQDVFHREIRKLDAGKKLKFKLRIESRFLRPTTYMLRIYLIRWVPAGSIMDEIEEAISQPKDMSEESKARAKSSAVEFFAKKKLDLFAPRMNTWKGKLLADWRWMEIIKIFPLWEVMAVFSAGIAVLSLLLGLVASRLL